MNRTVLAWRAKTIAYRGGPSAQMLHAGTVFRLDVRNGVPWRGLQLARSTAGERGGAWGSSNGALKTWCDLPVVGESL